MSDMGQQILQELLGCEWGRAVTTPDDEEACNEKAVTMVVVHEGPEDTAGRTLKLCARHLERIERETTPRPSDPEEGK